jgi:hypothetical protein
MVQYVLLVHEPADRSVHMEPAGRGAHGSKPGSPMEPQAVAMEPAGRGAHGSKPGSPMGPQAVACT